jgi:aryl-alcohol dehydrogenase-like predicted oxidoreductase
MSAIDKSPKELMEYRNLGRTGLKVSLLSFGAWVRLLKRKKNFLSSKIFL